MDTNNNYIYLVFEKTPENVTFLNDILAQYPEISQEKRLWDCIKSADIQYDAQGEPLVDENNKYIVSTEYGGIKVVKSIYESVKPEFEGVTRVEIEHPDLNTLYHSVYTLPYRINQDLI
jgi:hypothetical protein